MALAVLLLLCLDGALAPLLAPYPAGRLTSALSLELGGVLGASIAADGVFNTGGLASLFLDALGRADPFALTAFVVATAGIVSQRLAAAKAAERHLWGNGRGRFRTVGRFAATTVRGTVWLTRDTCTLTLVRVQSGRV